MGKIKAKRHAPHLDMTPMVDLAFLLVTFFMLTAKFAPQDAVKVTTPSSISETKLKEKDIMTIVIAKDNRVFFGMDNQQERMETLREVGRRKGIQFNEDQIAEFRNIENFGVPIPALPGYLSKPSEERKSEAQREPGIPCDSANNELGDWIMAGRLANVNRAGKPTITVAIKADSETNYPLVQRVIKTLQEKDINKFSLVTASEAKPQ